MFCVKCGSSLPDAAQFCGRCGAVAGQALAGGPAFQPPTPRAQAVQGYGEVLQADGRRGSKPRTYAKGKSPAIAVILSVLIVGLGQLYNGDTKKGAMMLVGAVIGGIVSLSLLWWAMAIWSAIDGYRVASGQAPLWL